jgi:hypothetical protein
MLTHRFEALSSLSLLMPYSDHIMPQQRKRGPANPLKKAKRKAAKLARKRTRVLQGRKR